MCNGPSFLLPGNASPLIPRDLNQSSRNRWLLRRRKCDHFVRYAWSQSLKTRDLWADRAFLVKYLLTSLITNIFIFFFCVEEQRYVTAAGVKGVSSWAKREGKANLKVNPLDAISIAIGKKKIKKKNKKKMAIASRSLKLRGFVQFTRAFIPKSLKPSFSPLANQTRFQSIAVFLALSRW